jgi:hypothetical protein
LNHKIPDLFNTFEGLLNGDSVEMRVRSCESERDEALRRYLSDCNVEIIVLVEATEAITGSSLQARHSYAFNSGDIVFDHTFVPCVERAPSAPGAWGGPVINMDRFHMLRPVNKDVDKRTHMPSL